MIGALVGLLHVRLRIPSFMASLAMGFVGTGAAILITGGAIGAHQDKAFRGLLTIAFPAIPADVLAGWRWSVFWRHGSSDQDHAGAQLHAVGGSEELAHASG